MLEQGKDSSTLAVGETTYDELTKNAHCLSPMTAGEGQGRVWEGGRGEAKVS